MSSHQNRVGVRVLVHRLFQTFREILLKWSVLNNWNSECVVEAQHTLTPTTRNSLDLFNVANLEAAIRTLLALDQEGHQHGPLRVGVNGAESSTFKCRKEQGRAVRRLQCEGLADVLALGGRVLRSRPLQDEDVVWLHHFLLDAGRSDENMVTVTDRSLEWASC